MKDIPPGERRLEALRALYNEGDAPWFAGFDPRCFAGGYPEAIAAAGGAAWLLYYRDATPQQLQLLAAYGLEGIAWTVNLRDKAALRQLLRSGVQQVMLDYPGVDLKALAADP